MATMMKEKRKEKNKTKDKSSSLKEFPTTAIERSFLAEEIHRTKIIQKNNTKDKSSSVKEFPTTAIERSFLAELCKNTIKLESSEDASNITDFHKDISSIHNIEITIPETETTVSDQINIEEHSRMIKSQHESSLVLEDVIPSAPCFEAIPQNILCVHSNQEVIVKRVPKMCTPIEDVIRYYSGGDMEEVRAMSQREEEIVENGPLSGPEHPLVDLLSTLRSSLMAVERERLQLIDGFANEEKSRSTLWKIDKESVYVTEKCQCGVNIDLKATYEKAELVREKLPIAKMKLEGLLRDAQDSYCHHQHIALLTYNQIEELISETIKISNKSVIREALSLVLVSLRTSVNAPDVLASALEYWAAALAAALIDHRDLRQLLFILHHLFKQSRSVKWASRVIQVHVDLESPARVLALLELLLTRPRLDNAQECTEDEAWEEVDKRGDAGAVSEGTLRERDLLSLLHALPVRDMVSRMLLFKHNDINQADPQNWGDSSGAHNVLRACYGVRSLIHVLQRAMKVHGNYARLRKALRDIAASALHALACLQLTISHCSQDFEDKLSSELEGAFFECHELFESRELHRLPCNLLTEDTAKNYCLKYIEQLHDTGTLPCNDRIRIVSQAAVDRTIDHELARIVIEFLMQIGLRSKTVQCKNSCDQTARECLPDLLSAHPYLHTIALHILADMNMVQTLEVGCVSSLHTRAWRPSTGEVRTLLDDWAGRCPHLLHHLLLQLDYTPHVSIPLEVQLTIGSWVCSYVQSTVTNGAVPECWWMVLRRLRTHRSAWLLPLDAPPPDQQPTNLFSIAYSLLSTSWGHCIPLICSEGVSALCKLSAQRPRDAVHCLSGIMFVMAQSPESVTFTPKFTEVFESLLNWGPSLIARALGRGGLSGSELLLRLAFAQLDNEQCDRPSVLNAWMHALWRTSHASTALEVVDSLACQTRLWPQIDAYANLLMQEENSKEYVNHMVRMASTAPLLCESVLRARHAQHELVTNAGYERVLNELHHQLVKKQRIHVDNAIQQVNVNISSEDLVIYRTASAALVAPLNHPSHLTLWRLVMHLYLQRPPNYNSESITPVGPLFFSGLIKSRTLGQMKKRVQESIIYHHNEAESLKTRNSMENNPSPSTAHVTRSSSGTVDNNLLPILSIVDLTGEKTVLNDSEDSGQESATAQIVQNSPQSVEEKRDVLNLISYHKSAEKMLGEYLCWLNSGDNVRAMPHHADITRFIPEHALEAAWKRAVTLPVNSEDLDELPMPTHRPALDNSPPHSPFHKAVRNIMKIKDQSNRRYKRHKIMKIKSHVEDVDFRDARSLMTVVDKHLSDMEKLACEWCSEVSRISELDAKLWELVGVLRVSRPLPPVRKQCIKKCEPVTFRIPAREWCLSVDATQGIKENRSSARAALRRLARPRPAAARTAAALYTIARRARSSEAAVRIVERAWRCAGSPQCDECAPAKSVLTALVTDLSQYWIADNGRLCSELLSSWGKCSSSNLQQTLCRALLSPRRLPSTDWPAVYIPLLDSRLPSHAVFSYLSKFEMSRWSQSADATQRREVLTALLRAVQRNGLTPAKEHQMLTELLSVHAAQVMTSHDIPAHVMDCARLSIHNKLPYTHWTHLVHALHDKVANVPFDQLGHLLRELGVMWWEARTATSCMTDMCTHAAYAPYIANLLHTLLRAFVASAVSLSYEPERVALYACSALQESWSAWISPDSESPPLLPATVENEQYTSMLRHFIDSIHQIMLDCPGTEICLLQQIFEWCIQVYVNVHNIYTAIPHMTAVSSVTQECRVQASALLVELSKLPWNEHQWFYGKSLQVALQMSTCMDRELTSWCAAAWCKTAAKTLLQDCGDQLVPRLATILYLLTGSILPPSQQVIEEACKLPWTRLPERALDEALERFFAVHYNVAQPYHDLPQFRLILMACELVLPPAAVQSSSIQWSGSSRSKRALGISQWVRAASSPALHLHVTAQTSCLLITLATLVPFLNSSEGELDDLLSRAVVIMCIEPAASVALPVWTKYMSRADVRMCTACVSAAAALTAFEYCAELCDAAVRAAVRSTLLPSWSELCSCWRHSSWRDGSAFVSRARLHAAYLCVLTHEHTPQQQLATLQALLSVQIHFADNEAIVGVWICLVTRWLRTANISPEMLDCGRTVLSGWTQLYRYSLLSRVIRNTHTDQPTPIHRVLCFYALYILDTGESTRKEFVSAYVSFMGTNNDLSTLTVTPQYNKLVTLAVRLLPRHQHYFQYELQNL